MDTHPVTWGFPREAADDAHARLQLQRARDERYELGAALRARGDDVLEYCQKKSVAKRSDVSLEVASRHPLWDLVALAVTSIADWLQTGDAADDSARTRIASVGSAAAIDQDNAIADRSVDNHVERSLVQNSETGPSGVLSVALFMKLNLWWKDATCQVLEEEGLRLGTRISTLTEATDMVAQSCNASMIRMAKQYDSELEELHERLLHLATHDQLTGLANRTVFLARLETAIGRIARHTGGLAVVFIDLDNFKSVNDSFGHASGDELLTAVAQRLANEMRPEDTIARFGGDEFVALFQDLVDPAVEAESLARRLQGVLADPIVISGEPLYMTASIGVAVATGFGHKSQDVLALADMTMYGVKRAGRNRVSVVELGPNGNTAVFAMASELHAALEHQDLHLVYQPVFGTSDRRLTGFEALCRWDHGERGTIPPIDFIPVAEESGLMPTLGAWVLGEACRQVVAWNSLLGDGLSMAVNVSGRQLADPAFVALVADALSTTGLRPEALILELTESILLGEHANYEAVLSDLKGLGVRLSIDDFGTGYSSLAYLRRFTVDQLKVDRGFVQDVAEHGDTRIIGAVVRLAHDLGLEVVAEGVETEDELSIVRKLECDSMQGFLLGYPLAPALVEETFAVDHLLSTI